MRVIVDKQACVGHGRCHAEAPDVFDLDDLGNCAQDEVDVPEELQAEAAQGAGACPERAIKVIP